MQWRLACEDETTIPPFIRRIREYATSLQVGTCGPYTVTARRGWARENSLAAWHCLTDAQEGCSFLRASSRTHQKHPRQLFLSCMPQRLALLQEPWVEDLSSAQFPSFGLLLTLRLERDTRRSSLTSWHDLPSPVRSLHRSSHSRVH